MNIMERAIRIECYQSTANYRKPSSFIIKESYPMPPYSTVIGMVHAVCGFKEYHPMKVSIQGTNSGSVSELYTRYSFSMDSKYDAVRHNVCIDEGDKKYGAFKGIAHVELICNSRMIIHIVPEEQDYDRVLEGLNNPVVYPSLGRYEDLLDIQSVREVTLSEDEEVETLNDIYMPVSSEIEMAGTVYTLTKEYEITKQGLRRWKREGGKIRVYHMTKVTVFEEVCVDDMGAVVALA